MNILYLRTVFWLGIKSGGSVGHTAGVINALSKHVTIDVISNDTLAEVHTKIDMISPGFLKFVPFRLGEVLYSLKIIHKMREKLKNYSCIYQRYSGLSFAGAYLSRKYQIPLILEFNSSDVWKLKHWSVQGSLLISLLARFVNLIKLPIVMHIENYNLSRASIIVVVSQPLKDSLIESGIPEEKILVNFNGVDQKKYYPDLSGNEVRVKYGLTNQKVVGFIGTFGQWHGVVEMARAIELFFQNHPDKKKEVKFLLVGDGRLMPEVKRIISKSNNNRNVVFAGLVPQSEGPEYLAACDILLSPHKKNPDGSKFFGSPTKLFEYMAMGKAIIASELDQIAEILEHKKTGYLVEPEHINQLANAIQVLLDDSDLREKLGRNAQVEVLRKYTWEKHVEKLLKKINEIIPPTRKIDI